MTVRAAWLVNDTMSGEDIRLSQTAQQVHDTAIRSRSGVVPAPSNPLAATIGSGMVVNVSAGQLIIGGQRAGAQGTYVITNDAVKALTIANGDAAQPRTDAIVGYIRDTTYGDTTQIGDIGVITGVAGVSFPVPTYTGTTALGTAVLLATVKVLANTTAGGGGLSGMGATLTDQRQYAVAVGGVLPVGSQAEEDALAQYNGLTVLRTDLTGGSRLRVSNGTAFSPAGAIGRVASVKKTTTFPPSGGSDQLVTGLSTSFAAVSGRRYRISWKIAGYDTGGTAAIACFLRDGGASAVTTASTLIDQVQLEPRTTGTAAIGAGFIEYVAASTGTKNIAVSVQVLAFTTSVVIWATASVPMSILVEDIGV